VPTKQAVVVTAATMEKVIELVEKAFVRQRDSAARHAQF
jgi:hypothetical protein